MSLSTATLVAPTPVVVPSVVVPSAVARDALEATPFARPPAASIGGWVAGLLFGAVCILAGFTLLAVIGAIALAGVVRRGVSNLGEGAGEVRAGSWTTAVRPMEDGQGH